MTIRMMIEEVDGNLRFIECRRRNYGLSFNLNLFLGHPELNVYDACFKLSAFFAS